MIKRFAVLAALVACFVVVGAASALATANDQANGQGQTPLSASLGFNAKSDLKGSLEYNSDPKGQTPDFKAHCNDYSSFSLTYKQNAPKVNVTATCTDQDGTTVYLKAAFWDRGEPGTNDVVCIRWRYGNSGTYIHDYGVISNGNIQIHAH